MARMERDVDGLVERPGSAVILVYVAMAAWGLVLGVGLGWLVWG